MSVAACPVLSCLRDKKHVEWVKAYLSIWAELQGYIKQHHTTGVVWSKSVSTLPPFRAPASPNTVRLPASGALLSSQPRNTVYSLLGSGGVRRLCSRSFSACCRRSSPSSSSARAPAPFRGFKPIACRRRRLPEHAIRFPQQGF